MNDLSITSLRYNSKSGPIKSQRPLQSLPYDSINLQRFRIKKAIRRNNNIASLTIKTRPIKK